jgi:tRNA1Val (adenine37-N6)-methyltransferase
MRKLPGSKSEETFDTLFGGRLEIRQRKEGYRFSVDALLLAHFAELRLKDRVVDLGTGCGVIPLILVYRRKAEAVVGIEVQPSLAALARQNVSRNRFSGQIEIREGDFRNLPEESGAFDCALCNPPYRRAGSGRVNPQEEKALARHEINATLEDVLRAAHHLLKNKGRFYSIYPAARTADLLHGLRRFHLEPKRVQFVYSREGEDARLVLVEAFKEGKTQVKVLPPFILYTSGNQYTVQGRALFSEPAP